ncbi:MAG: hypothetical protein EOO88_55765 [Pedobacter sp.]|nr:MAG: hypothetical protein EOO88_55765 [Pedobacter sp.]
MYILSGISVLCRDASVAQSFFEERLGNAQDIVVKSSGDYAFVRVLLPVEEILRVSPHNLKWEHSFVCATSNSYFIGYIEDVIGILAFPIGFEGIHSLDEYRDMILQRLQKSDLNHLIGLVGNHDLQTLLEVGDVLGLV